MSFSQGISGLAASAAQLDAIGNNIANSATVGYKSSTVAFKDVIAGSKIGLGVSVSAVQQNFSAGSVQLTSRPLDLAIINGNGFFRVESPEGGSVSYSRNGQFTVDANGYVVSPNGMRLTGYGVTANGSLAGGTPTVTVTDEEPGPAAGVASEQLVLVPLLSVAAGGLSSVTPLGRVLVKVTVWGTPVVLVSA